MHWQNALDFMIYSTLKTVWWHGREIQFTGIERTTKDNLILDGHINQIL